MSLYLAHAWNTEGLSKCLLNEYTDLHNLWKSMDHYTYFTGERINGKVSQSPLMADQNFQKVLNLM